MDVRYNPILGWVCIVVGGVSFLLALWLLGLGVFQPSLIIGPIIILLGVRYLRREYFSLTRQGVFTPAPFGSAQRQTTVEAGETLALENNRLVVVNSSGIRHKVRVSRWMAHPTDWRAMEAYLGANQAR